MQPTDQFDVIILGFEPREESPAARLQRVFGIEAAVAARLVTDLPRTVQRAVSRVRAEYFRRALTLLGARVEIRDPNATVVVAEESLEETQPPIATATQAQGLSLPPWARAVDAQGATDPCPSALHAPLGATVAIAASASAMPHPQADLAEGLRLRAPAQPTVREVVAPVLHSVFTERDPISRQGPRAPSTPPAAPLAPAAPANMGSAPAPASSPADLPWARVPSSVWDPPPSKPSARKAVGQVVPVYQEPAAQLRAPQAAALADAASLRSDPRFESNAVHFDLTKSIAVNPVWRPPAAPDAAPPSVATSGLTLDSSPGPIAVDLQPQWELPSFESMAEPAPRPLVAPPASKRPLVAAAPALPAGPSRRPAPTAEPSGASAEPRPNPAKAARPPGKPGPPRRAPAAAVGMPSRNAREPASRLDLRSFWQTFGEALALPFSGPGVYWIAAITLWSVLVGVLDMLSGFAFILGWIVMFCAHTSLLALACDYYRVCLWVPAAGDKVLDRGPELDPARVLDRYIKSGLHLSLFIIASQIPLLWWIFHSVNAHAPLLEVVTDPFTWLLALLPYYYWPMGVGLAALDNDFAAIWKLPTGFRAIVRAPLEYSAIVAVGVAALVLSWVGLLVFGSFLGVTGGVISSAIGLPLAISHGVQGALMGHLIRARAEIFE